MKVVPTSESGRGEDQCHPEGEREAEVLDHQQDPVGARPRQVGHDPHAVPGVAEPADDAEHQADQGDRAGPGEHRGAHEVVRIDRAAPSPVSMRPGHVRRDQLEERVAQLRVRLQEQAEGRGGDPDRCEHGEDRLVRESHGDQRAAVVVEVDDHPYRLEAHHPVDDPGDPADDAARLLPAQPRARARPPCAHPSQDATEFGGLHRSRLCAWSFAEWEWDAGSSWRPCSTCRTPCPSRWPESTASIPRSSSPGSRMPWRPSRPSWTPARRWRAARRVG